MEIILNNNEAIELKKIFTSIQLEAMEINQKDIQSIHEKIRVNMPNFYNDLESAKENANYIYIDSDLCVARDKKYEQKAYSSLCLGLSMIIGTPFQYKEQSDALVCEVKPRRELMHTHSSGGNKEFGWHTDEGCFPKEFRSSWLLLAGVINDSKCSTYISDIKDIVSKLDAEDIDKLCLKKYIAKQPQSFSELHESLIQNPMSILTQDGDSYDIAIRADDVKSTDRKYRGSIDNLVSAADQSQNQYFLDSGKMLFINNNKTLHRRDKVDGERLVFRINITNHISFFKENFREVGFNVFELNSMASRSY